MKLNTTLRFKLNLGIISQTFVIILIIGTIFLLRTRISDITKSNTQVFNESKAIQTLAFDMKDYFDNKADYSVIKSQHEKINTEIADEGMLEGLQAVMAEIDKIETVVEKNKGIENEILARLSDSYLTLNDFITGKLKELENTVDRYRVSTSSRKTLSFAYSILEEHKELENSFTALKTGARSAEEYLSTLKTLQKSVEDYIMSQESDDDSTILQGTVGNVSSVSELSNNYLTNLKYINEQKQLAVESTDNLFIILNQGDIASKSEGLKNLRNLMRTAFMVLIAVSLFVIVLNLITSVSVNLFIKRLSYFLTEMGKGNLSLKVSEDALNRKDEFGQISRILDNTSRKLVDTMSTIRMGAEQIANVSSQLSASSQQISQGASEQASSLEQVSSSMEEMVSNIEQNSENALQTKQIAGHSADGMEIIGGSSKENLDAVTNIASKITIVNDIAFQTNILALNAAVEAARAGEHGKGFAVVAAEVRKLAERSKIAADEIDVLSKNSVKSTEEARGQMEVIIPEIIKTSQLVEEIAASSSEQKQGAEQINGALQQLNGVTQQNASSSEELASSAEELSGQAEELKRVVNFFKFEEVNIGELLLSKSKGGNGSPKELNTTFTPGLHVNNKPATQFKPEKTESAISFDMDEGISDGEFEKF